MYSYMIYLNSYDSTDTIELLHTIKYDRDEFTDFIKESVDPMIDQWFSKDLPYYGWKYDDIYLLDCNGGIIDISMPSLIYRLVKYMCSMYGFTVHSPNIAVSISFDYNLNAEDFIAMGTSENIPDKINKFVIDKVVEKLNTIKKADLMTLDQYISMCGDPSNEFELTDIINKYEIYKESMK